MKKQTVTSWDKMKRPFGENIGDRGFEVEWCYFVACEPDDPMTMNPDSAKYECRDFATIEEARYFARWIYPKDVMGSVRILPFRIIEHPSIPIPCPEREYYGEDEFYEGEE